MQGSRGREWSLTAQTGGIPAGSSVRKSPGQGNPLGAPLSTAHPVETREGPITHDRQGFRIRTASNLLAKTLTPTIGFTLDSGA